MPKKQEFKGFGGSGGGGKPPETAISGTSTSIASVLGIVSEGEIEGPVDGLKSVYLDETPIQNSDNSHCNFTYSLLGIETQIWYFPTSHCHQGVLQFHLLPISD